MAALGDTRRPALRCAGSGERLRTVPAPPLAAPHGDSLGGCRKLRPRRRRFGNNRCGSNSRLCNCSECGRRNHRSGNHMDRKCGDARRSVDRSGLLRTSFAVLTLAALACARGSESNSDTAVAGVAVTSTDSAGSYPMTLKVTSSEFQQGGSIPSQYTCEGKDSSPPLSWSGVPSNAKTVAMIVDDPDAPDPAKPQRVYVHWVVYNIPAQTTSLKENASKSGIPAGAVQGKNDWGKPEYGGAKSPRRAAPLIFTPVRPCAHSYRGEGR